MLRSLLRKRDDKSEISEQSSPILRQQSSLKSPSRKRIAPENVTCKIQAVLVEEDVAAEVYFRWKWRQITDSVVGGAAVILVSSQQEFSRLMCMPEIVSSADGDKASMPILVDGPLNLCRQRTEEEDESLCSNASVPLSARFLDARGDQFGVSTLGMFAANRDCELWLVIDFRKMHGDEAVGFNGLLDESRKMGLFTLFPQVRIEALISSGTFAQQGVNRSDLARRIGEPVKWQISPTLAILDSSVVSIVPTAIASEFPCCPDGWTLLEFNDDPDSFETVVFGTVKLTSNGQQVFEYSALAKAISMGRTRFIIKNVPNDKMKRRVEQYIACIAESREMLVNSRLIRLDAENTEKFSVWAMGGWFQDEQQLLMDMLSKFVVFRGTEVGWDKKDCLLMSLTERNVDEMLSSFRIVSESSQVGPLQLPPMSLEGNPRPVNLVEEFVRVCENRKLHCVFKISSQLSAFQWQRFFLACSPISDRTAVYVWLLSTECKPKIPGIADFHISIQSDAIPKPLLDLSTRPGSPCRQRFIRRCRVSPCMSANISEFNMNADGPAPTLFSVNSSTRASELMYRVVPVGSLLKMEASYFIRALIEKNGFAIIIGVEDSIDVLTVLSCLFQPHPYLIFNGKLYFFEDIPDHHSRLYCLLSRVGFASEVLGLEMVEQIKIETDDSSLPNELTMSNNDSASTSSPTISSPTTTTSPPFFRIRSFKVGSNTNKFRIPIRASSVKGQPTQPLPTPSDDILGIIKLVLELCRTVDVIEGSDLQLILRISRQVEVERALDFSESILPVHWLWALKHSVLSQFKVDPERYSFLVFVSNMMFAKAYPQEKWLCFLTKTESIRKTAMKAQSMEELKGSFCWQLAAKLAPTKVLRYFPSKAIPLDASLLSDNAVRELSTHFVNMALEEIEYFAPSILHEIGASNMRLDDTSMVRIGLREKVVIKIARLASPPNKNGQPLSVQLWPILERLNNEGLDYNLRLPVWLFESLEKAFSCSSQAIHGFKLLLEDQGMVSSNLLLKWNSAILRLEKMLRLHPCIIVAGREGTGKTTLISAAIDLNPTEKKIAVFHITDGPMIDESVLSERLKIGNDGAICVAQGPLLQWANTTSPNDQQYAILVVDDVAVDVQDAEGRVIRCGIPMKWELLRGMFSQQPHICIQGKKIALTSNHRVAMTTTLCEGSDVILSPLLNENGVLQVLKPPTMSDICRMLSRTHFGMGDKVAVLICDAVALYHQLRGDSLGRNGIRFTFGEANSIFQMIRTTIGLDVIKDEQIVVQAVRGSPLKALAALSLSPTSKNSSEGVATLPFSSKPFRITSSRNLSSMGGLNPELMLELSLAVDMFLSSDSADFVKVMSELHSFVELGPFDRGLVQLITNHHEQFLCPQLKATVRIAQWFRLTRAVLLRWRIQQEQRPEKCIQIEKLSWGWAGKNDAKLGNTGKYPFRINNETSFQIARKLWRFLSLVSSRHLSTTTLGMFGGLGSRKFDKSFHIRAAAKRCFLLEGPAGLGKDQLVQWVLEAMELPYRRFSLSQSLDDLFELLETSARDGYCVVVSEINMLESKYLEGRIKDILEDKTVHPAFSIIATINPPNYAGRCRPSSTFMKLCVYVNCLGYDYNSICQVARDHLQSWGLPRSSIGFASSLLNVVASVFLTVGMLLTDSGCNAQPSFPSFLEILHSFSVDPIFLHKLCTVTSVGHGFSTEIQKVVAEEPEWKTYCYLLWKHANAVWGYYISLDGSFRSDSMKSIVDLILDLHTMLWNLDENEIEAGAGRRFLISGLSKLKSKSGGSQSSLSDWSQGVVDDVFFSIQNARSNGDPISGDVFLSKKQLIESFFLNRIRTVFPEETAEIINAHEPAQYSPALKIGRFWIHQQADKGLLRKALVEVIEVAVRKQLRIAIPNLNALPKDMVDPLATQLSYDYLVKSLGALGYCPGVDTDFQSGVDMSKIIWDLERSKFALEDRRCFVLKELRFKVNAAHIIMAAASRYQGSTRRYLAAKTLVAYAMRNVWSQRLALSGRYLIRTIIPRGNCRRRYRRLLASVILSCFLKRRRPRRNFSEWFCALLLTSRLHRNSIPRKQFLEHMGRKTISCALVRVWRRKHFGKIWAGHILASKLKRCFVEMYRYEVVNRAASRKLLSVARRIVMHTRYIWIVGAKRLFQRSLFRRACMRQYVKMACASDICYHRLQCLHRKKYIKMVLEDRHFKKVSSSQYIVACIRRNPIREQYIQQILAANPADNIETNLPDVISKDSFQTVVVFEIVPVVDNIANAKDEVVCNDQNGNLENTSDYLSIQQKEKTSMQDNCDKIIPTIDSNNIANLAACLLQSLIRRSVVALWIRRSQKAIFVLGPFFRRALVKKYSTQYLKLRNKTFGSGRDVMTGPADVSELKIDRSTTIDGIHFGTVTKMQIPGDNSGITESRIPTVVHPNLESESLENWIRHRMMDDDDADNMFSDSVATCGISNVFNENTISSTTVFAPLINELRENAHIRWEESRGDGQIRVNSLEKLGDTEFLEQITLRSLQIYCQKTGNLVKEGSEMVTVKVGNQTIAAPALDKDDLLAAALYTHETPPLYRYINMNLRKSASPDEQIRMDADAALSKFKSYFYHLVKAIHILEGFAGISQYYRGVEERVKFGGKYYVAGSVVVMREALSCSKSLNVAARFAKQRGTILDIKVDEGNGANLIPYSIYSHEEELLLPPFSCFLVLSIHQTANHTIIKLQHLGHKSSLSTYVSGPLFSLVCSLSKTADFDEAPVANEVENRQTCNQYHPYFLGENDMLILQRDPEQRKQICIKLLSSIESNPKWYRYYYIKTSFPTSVPENMMTLWQRECQDARTFAALIVSTILENQDLIDKARVFLDVDVFQQMQSKDACVTLGTFIRNIAKGVLKKNGLSCDKDATITTPTSDLVNRESEVDYAPDKRLEYLVELHITQVNDAAQYIQACIRRYFAKLRQLLIMEISYEADISSKVRIEQWMHKQIFDSRVDIASCFKFEVDNLQQQIASVLKKKGCKVQHLPRAYSVFVPVFVVEDDVEQLMNNNEFCFGVASKILDTIQLLHSAYSYGLFRSSCYERTTLEEALWKRERRHLNGIASAILCVMLASDELYARIRHLVGIKKLQSLQLSNYPLHELLRHLSSRLQQGATLECASHKLTNGWFKTKAAQCKLEEIIEWRLSTVKNCCILIQGFVKRYFAKRWKTAIDMLSRESDALSIKMTFDQWIQEYILSQDVNNSQDLIQQALERFDMTAHEIPKFIRFRDQQNYIFGSYSIFIPEFLSEHDLEQLRSDQRFCTSSINKLLDAVQSSYSSKILERCQKNMVLGSSQMAIEMKLYEKQQMHIEEVCGAIVSAIFSNFQLLARLRHVITDSIIHNMKYKRSVAILGIILRKISKDGRKDGTTLIFRNDEKSCGNYENNAQIQFDTNPQMILETFDKAAAFRLSVLFYFLWRDESDKIMHQIVTKAKFRKDTAKRLFEFVRNNPDKMCWDESTELPRIPTPKYCIEDVCVALICTILSYSDLYSMVIQTGGEEILHVLKKDDAINSLSSILKVIASRSNLQFESELQSTDIFVSWSSVRGTDVYQNLLAVRRQSPFVVSDIKIPSGLQFPKKEQKTNSERRTTRPPTDSNMAHSSRTKILLDEPATGIVELQSEIEDDGQGLKIWNAHEWCYWDPKKGGATDNRIMFFHQQLRTCVYSCTPTMISTINSEQVLSLSDADRSDILCLNLEDLSNFIRYNLGDQAAFVLQQSWDVAMKQPFCLACPLPPCKILKVAVTTKEFVENNVQLTQSIATDQLFLRLQNQDICNSRLLVHWLIVNEPLLPLSLPLCEAAPSLPSDIHGSFSPHRQNVVKALLKPELHGLVDSFRSKVHSTGQQLQLAAEWPHAGELWKWPGIQREDATRIFVSLASCLGVPARAVLCNNDTYSAELYVAISQHSVTQIAENFFGMAESSVVCVKKLVNDLQDLLSANGSEESSTQFIASFAACNPDKICMSSQSLVDGVLRLGSEAESLLHRVDSMFAKLQTRLHLLKRSSQALLKAASLKTSMQEKMVLFTGVDRISEVSRHLESMEIDISACRNVIEKSRSTIREFEGLKTMLVSLLRLGPIQHDAISAAVQHLDDTCVKFPSRCQISSTAGWHKVALPKMISIGAAFRGSNTRNDSILPSAPDILEHSWTFPLDFHMAVRDVFQRSDYSTEQKSTQYQQLWIQLAGITSQECAFHNGALLSVLFSDTRDLGMNIVSDWLMDAVAHTDVNIVKASIDTLVSIDKEISSNRDMLLLVFKKLCRIVRIMPQPCDYAERTNEADVIANAVLVYKFDCDITTRLLKDVKHAFRIPTFFLNLLSGAMSILQIDSHDALVSTFHMANAPFQVQYSGSFSQNLPNSWMLRGGNLKHFSPDIQMQLLEVACPFNLDVDKRSQQYAWGAFKVKKLPGLEISSQLLFDLELGDERKSVVFKEMLEIRHHCAEIVEKLVPRDVVRGELLSMMHPAVQKEYFDRELGRPSILIPPSEFSTVFARIWLGVCLGSVSAAGASQFCWKQIQQQPSLLSDVKQVLSNKPQVNVKTLKNDSVEIWIPKLKEIIPLALCLNRTELDAFLENIMQDINDSIKTVRSFIIGLLFFMFGIGWATWHGKNRVTAIESLTPLKLDDRKWLQGDIDVPTCGFYDAKFVSTVSGETLQWFTLKKLDYVAAELLNRALCTYSDFRFRDSDAVGVFEELVVRLFCFPLFEFHFLGHLEFRAVGWMIELMATQPGPTTGPAVFLLDAAPPSSRMAQFKKEYKEFLSYWFPLNRSFPVMAPARFSKLPVDRMGRLVRDLVQDTSQQLVLEYDRQGPGRAIVYRCPEWVWERQVMTSSGTSSRRLVLYLPHCNADGLNLVIKDSDMLVCAAFVDSLWRYCSGICCITHLGTCSPNNPAELWVLGQWSFLFAQSLSETKLAISPAAAQRCDTTAAVRKMPCIRSLGDWVLGPLELQEMFSAYYPWALQYIGNKSPNKDELDTVSFIRSCRAPDVPILISIRNISTELYYCNNSDASLETSGESEEDLKPVLFWGGRAITPPIGHLNRMDFETLKPSIVFGSTNPDIRKKKPRKCESIIQCDRFGNAEYIRRCVTGLVTWGTHHDRRFGIPNIGTRRIERRGGEHDIIARNNYFSSVFATVSNEWHGLYPSPIQAAKRFLDLFTPLSDASRKVRADFAKSKKELELKLQEISGLMDAFWRSNQNDIEWYRLNTADTTLGSEIEGHWKRWVKIQNAMVKLERNRVRMIAVVDSRNSTDVVAELHDAHCTRDKFGNPKFLIRYIGGPHTSSVVQKKVHEIGDPLRRMDVLVRNKSFSSSVGDCLDHGYTVYENSYQICFGAPPEQWESKAPQLWSGRKFGGQKINGVKDIFSSSWSFQSKMTSEPKRSIVVPNSHDKALASPYWQQLDLHSIITIERKTSAGLKVSARSSTAKVASLIKKKVARQPLDKMGKFHQEFTLIARSNWKFLQEWVKNENQLSILFHSAHIGDVSELEKCLKEVGTAAARFKDLLGQTALHWAAQSNQKTAVDVLLKSHADPNASNYRGNTAAAEAAMRGHFEVSGMVMTAAGANSDVFMQEIDRILGSRLKKHSTGRIDVRTSPNCPHCQNDPCFHLAPSTSDSMILGLEHLWWKLTTICSKKSTTWLSVVSMGNFHDVVSSTTLAKSESSRQLQFLNALKTILPKESADVMGRTALHWAVATADDCADLVNWLLENEISNIDSRDWRGQTALHIATEHGNLSAVKLLLTRHAKNPTQLGSIPDNRGCTAMQIVLQKLVAIVSLRSDDTETPCPHCDSSGSNLYHHVPRSQLCHKFEHILWLLDSLRCDFDEMSRCPPVHEVVRKSKTISDSEKAVAFRCTTTVHTGDECRKLLQQFLAKSCDGILFLSSLRILQCIQGYKKLHLWNQKLGDDLETSNPCSSVFCNQTLLHHVAATGDADSIRFLVQEKADPMCKDSFGRTPLHYASRNGNSATVLTLCQLDEKNLASATDNIGKHPLNYWPFQKNVQDDSMCVHALSNSLSNIENALYECAARGSAKLFGVLCGVLFSTGIVHACACNWHGSDCKLAHQRHKSQIETVLLQVLRNGATNIVIEIIQQNAALTPNPSKGGGITLSIPAEVTKSVLVATLLASSKRCNPNQVRSLLPLLPKLEIKNLNEALLNACRGSISDDNASSGAISVIQTLISAKAEVENWFYLEGAEKDAAKNVMQILAKRRWLQKCTSVGRWAKQDYRLCKKLEGRVAESVVEGAVALKALHVAAINGNVAVVRSLLELKANPDCVWKIENVCSNSLIHSLLESGLSPKTLESLISNEVAPQVSPNISRSVDILGCDALLACCFARLKMAANALAMRQLGMDGIPRIVPQVPPREGCLRYRTAVHFFVEQGDAASVRALLSHPTTSGRVCDEIRTQDGITIRKDVKPGWVPSQSGLDKQILYAAAVRGDKPMLESLFCTAESKTALLHDNDGIGLAWWLFLPLAPNCVTRTQLLSSVLELAQMTANGRKIDPATITKYHNTVQVIEALRRHGVPEGDPDLQVLVNQTQREVTTRSFRLIKPSEWMKRERERKEKMGEANVVK